MQRATPTSLMLRRMTASAVLDALRAGGPMTGSDLMSATGLARPTIHVVCNDLIRLGWIREMDSRRPTGEGRRGRPARCYEFQSRAGFVLGIDATDRVTVRLADLRGDRVAEASEPLAHVSVPAGERVAAVRRAADAALSSAAVDPARVLAVTMGVPTPVDAEGRPVGREAYLPGLPGRDLGTEIGGRNGWLVVLENDANLAALGERWRGVAAGVDDLVVMVADERLGSGLFLGGRPVRGHAGGAGELRVLELIERVGSTYGIASLVRTLGAEAVARWCGGTGRPRRRGRLLWTWPAATRRGSRQRRSWRRPGPGTRSPWRSSTRWPTGWRTPWPPWPGCSTLSWWSSQARWPTRATCSSTVSGPGCSPT